MRVLHICLNGPYTDGYGYQDNLITKYHVELGYTVTIIANTEKYDNGKLVKSSPCEYESEYGQHVIRLQVSSGVGGKLRNYDIYDCIVKACPDIIFVHGVQSISLKDVIKYKKKHPNVKIYLDNHADYYNSPAKKLHTKILTKYIWGHYTRKIAKYAQKFWGTTPWRCQYLCDIFGVPKDKVGLLVMGGDDEKINFEHKDEFRDSIRKELDIGKNDFVIVTGGKIDRTKNIHLLMQAVTAMDRKDVKLIVFGKPSEDMREEIDALSKHESIRFLGWINSDKAYDYFLASELAVFPGTHSVLWEQACACGIPCLFKSWEGMHHVDLGGNCGFLYEDGQQEIEQALSQIISDKNKYNDMKEVAQQKCVKEFSYRDIAKRAIEI